MKIDLKNSLAAGVMSGSLIGVCAIVGDKISQLVLQKIFKVSDRSFLLVGRFFGAGIAASGSFAILMASRIITLNPPFIATAAVSFLGITGASILLKKASRDAILAHIPFGKKKSTPKPGPLPGQPNNQPNTPPFQNPPAPQPNIPQPDPSNPYPQPNPNPVPPTSSTPIPPPPPQPGTAQGGSGNNPPTNPPVPKGSSTVPNSSKDQTSQGNNVKPKPAPVIPPIPLDQIKPKRAPGKQYHTIANFGKTGPGISSKQGPTPGTRPLPTPPAPWQNQAKKPLSPRSTVSPPSGESGHSVTFNIPPPPAPAQNTATMPPVAPVAPQVQPLSPRSSATSQREEKVEEPKNEAPHTGKKKRRKKKKRGRNRNQAVNSPPAPTSPPREDSPPSSDGEAPLSPLARQISSVRLKATDIKQDHPSQKPIEDENDAPGEKETGEVAQGGGEKKSTGSLKKKGSSKKTPGLRTTLLNSETMARLREAYGGDDDNCDDDFDFEDDQQLFDDVVFDSYN